MSKMIVKIFLMALFLVLPLPILATAGTIDAADRYGWSENAGWLDFGTGAGNVVVGDNALSGYIWGAKIGWISLNCANTDSCAAVDYKVANDGSGTLSGYAWGENSGWINFSPAGGGVSINSSGEFSGYAWGPKIGWVSFNCATTDSCAAVDYKVKTDWRAAEAQTPAASAPAQTGGIGGQYVWLKPVKPAPVLAESGGLNLAEKIIEIVKAPFAGLFGQKPAAESAAPESGPENIEPPAAARSEIVVPNLPQDKAAAALLENESKFSFLPESLLNFAKKFPELFATLKSTGIHAAQDLSKLRNISFVLPSLPQKIGWDDVFKKIAGFRFFENEIEKIPAEIVFARAGGAIDLPVKIAADKNGNAAQQINAIAAKPLELIVKPEAPARAVKGIIALKAKDGQTGFWRNLFLPAVSAQGETINALAEFDYDDADGDGVFTAGIAAPAVAGDYDLRATIDYQDAARPAKEIKINLLIDPEGYVFEKNNGKETRVPGAAVSLYRQNSETGAFELWPAQNYQQENPQTTDNRGTYAFLAPAGDYYLQAEAAGYPVYKGKIFTLTAGAGVHQNIELKKQFSWRDLFSWNWLMFAGLIAVAALLAVNFWRDRRRNN